MNDDDRLLTALRERANHPARHLDEVAVPLAWLAHHHPDLDQARIDQEFGPCAWSATVVLLPAGSWLALAYYRDVAVPVKLPAPLTGAQVARVEVELGHRLPELLRRVYTEIANGGFGPGAEGLHPLTDGDDTTSNLCGTWSSALAAHRHERNDGRPDWLCLAYDGCTVYWYVSLTEPDHPVYYFDWTDASLYSPDLHEGIGMVVPSLRAWLWAWAQGKDLMEQWPWVEPSDADQAAMDQRLEQLRAERDDGRPTTPDPWTSGTDQDAPPF